MRTFLLLTFILFPRLGFANSSWQCSDIPSLWGELQNAVKQSSPNPVLTKDFRQLVASCHKSDQLKGLNKQKYSLGNFDTLVASGYRVDLGKIIEARRLGLSADNNKLLQTVQQAKVPKSHVALLTEMPSGEKKCESFDYREKMPPIRDQGSMGWCFGHTAADLASFKLGKNISALDSAIVGHISMEHFPFGPGLLSFLNPPSLDVTPGDMDQGGLTARTLKAMNKQGLCLEENLPANDIRYELAAQDVRSRWARASNMVTQASGKCEGECELVASKMVRELAPNLNQQQVRDLLKHDDSETFITEVRNKACAKRLPFDAEVKRVETKNISKKNQAVREQFKEGNIVAISYDVDVLFGNRWEEGTSNHASSLIGQRWNKKSKRCEFLLRNSWGSSCGGYRSDFDCEPSGYVWVPAYDIMSATREVSYVE